VEDEKLITAMMKEKVYAERQAAKKGKLQRGKRKHELDGGGHQHQRRGGGGGRGGGRFRRRGGRGPGKYHKKSLADQESWCRI